MRGTALITRIVFLRHGESTFNTAGIIQGRGGRDCPEAQSVLSDRGHQQAILAGEALAALRFDAVYASPLLRACQTAERVLSCLAAPPPLSIHEGLLEIDLPLWEGMTFAALRERDPAAYSQWQDTPHELRMGDRYPVLDLFAQAQRLWDDLLTRHRGQTVLLVGHSGINRALICTATGIPPARYHYLQQSNGGISVLNVTQAGDRVRAQVESLNLTSHLTAISGSEFPAARGQGPRLLLVRHGETEWNRQTRFQGQIDVPLNPRGEEQARLAAQFLASVPLQRAFSSPMLRPKQTAEIILSAHPQVSLALLDDLKEIAHGRWEGKLESEIAGEYPDLLEAWRTAPETVQMPEGETLHQVWQRATAAWQHILDTTAPGETALVVAHDAVNKALLCDLVGLGPEAFWLFKQGNGGVSVIDYPRGRDRAPKLQSLNVTTHLSDSVLDRTAAGAL